MTLHLAHLICTICDQDIGAARVEVRLDQVDEEGRRVSSLYHDLMITIPPARYRDHIAPDMCDNCWHSFAIWSMRRSRNKPVPAFNTTRLIEWVAVQLQLKAKALMPKNGRPGISGRDRYLRACAARLEVRA